MTSAPIAELCACFNLKRATRLVTQIYDEELRPSGLRNTQFTLLAFVRSQGPLSMNELAEFVLTDRTTLTRNLGPLERDGLVTSGPGEDQRFREIAITGKGRRVLEKALPLWERAQERVRRRLGARDMKRLVGELRATVDELREP